MEIQGQCLCGAVRADLRLSRTAAEMPLRACQCSFCRAHGAATVTDPQGTVAIRVGGEADLIRYRFDKGTADFLICAHCGVYVAALLSDGARAWATVNAHGLGMAAFAGRAPEAVDYGDETAAARIARRKTAWTPARVDIESSRAA